jgi:hypothetical protein
LPRIHRPFFTRALYSASSLATLLLAATVAASASQVVITGDASVSSARSTTNYGALANLYVGNGNTTLIQYSLAPLPAGVTAAQISKATLTLFVNRVNTSGAISVAPITSAWTEGTVTYATIPGIGTTTATFTPTTAGTYVTLDITAIVQGWITNPGTNFGIALTSTAANVLFDSKENDETGHPAALDVTIVSMGAAGATGATGAQGVQGIQGIQGVTGTQGIAGAQGMTGFTGSTGTTGFTGTTGSNGFTGTTGSNGFTGATGIAGSTGFTGATGALGVTGATGTSGSTGATGIAGNTGFTGSTGAVGFTGSTGLQGTTGNSGATGSAGATGFTGATGAVGFTGSTGLQGTTGNSGATGSAGASGFTGATGAVGFTGFTGSTGFTGATGIAGNTGFTGATGTNGFTGVIGSTGNTGNTGATGMTGNTGVIGSTGATGPFVGGTYSATVAYPAGSVVSYNGTTYLALAASTGVTPGTNAADWVATTSSVTGNTPASYIQLTTVSNSTVANLNNYFIGSSTTSSTNSGFSFNSTTGVITVASPGTYLYDLVTPCYYGVVISGGNYAGGTANSNTTSPGANSGVVGTGIITTTTANQTVYVTNFTSSCTSTAQVESPSASFRLVSLYGGATGANGATGATGTNGSNGATGIIGNTGATGATGPFVGGTYSASVTYPAGAVVVYSGTTYVAIATTTGNAPPNATYWTATTGSGGTGTATSNYFTAYTLTTSAAIPNGGSFLASTNGVAVTVAQNSGYTWTASTGTLTITNAGTYLVDFEVSDTANYSAALYINGAAYATGSGGYYGSSTVVTVAAGATLQLLNKSGSVDTLSSTAGTESAYLRVVTAGGAAGATGATGATGAGLAAGTQAGQAYLTGTGGAVPTTPVSLTGDVGILSTGVTFIEGSASAGNDIVTALGVASTGTIPPARLGTSSGTATTYLNGAGAFTTPAAGGGSGISFYFASSNSGSSPIYVAPFLSAQTSASALAFNDLVFIPVACTLQDFNVVAYTVSTGTAQTFSATVYKNGSLSGTAYTVSPGTAQTMACSLTESATVGTKVSCTSANTVSMAAGDDFYIQFTESNPSNDPYMRYAVSLACR